MRVGWPAVERLRERVVGGKEEKCESESESEPEREGQLRCKV